MNYSSTIDFRAIIPEYQRLFGVSLSEALKAAATMGRTDKLGADALEAIKSGQPIPDLSNYVSELWRSWTPELTEAATATLGSVRRPLALQSNLDDRMVQHPEAHTTSGSEALTSDQIEQLRQDGREASTYATKVFKARRAKK